MKKIELGQVIGILANFGVIVGIIFLVIEIGQNQTFLEEANTINRLSADAETLAYFSAHRSLIAQDEQLAQIWLDGSSGEALTPVEALRFDFLCQNFLWTYAIIYQGHLGLQRLQRAQGAVSVLRRRFANQPGLVRCWEDMEPSVMEWGYEAFVDAVEGVEN